MPISKRKLHSVFAALGAAGPAPKESTAPGLGDSELALLIEMAAERQDKRLTGPIEPSARIRRLVDDFARAVRRELKAWASRNGGMFAAGEDHDELYFDDAPYAVLLTLRGDDLGVDDGRWDNHFRADVAAKAVASLEAYLKRRLRRWSYPGGGVLEAELDVEALRHFAAENEEEGEEYEFEIPDEEEDATDDEDDDSDEDADDEDDDEDDDGDDGDEEEDDEDEEEDERRASYGHTPFERPLSQGRRAAPAPHILPRPRGARR